MADGFPASEDDVVDAFVLRGWRDEFNAGARDKAVGEARAELDRLCAAGMRHVVSDGRRAFDPIDLNFATAIGLERNDPFFRERIVAPTRAAAARFAPEREPTERYHDPRRVSIRFWREIRYPDRKPGSRVIVSLPVPSEEPTQRNVVVTPEQPEGGTAAIEDGMLVARAAVSSDGRVRVGARIEFVGYQQTVPTSGPTAALPDDPSLARWLEPSEGILQITDSVRALARRLARQGTWETLLSFWDFFFDEKKMGTVYHHALDPNDPLGKSGEWLDCYVGSALFCAMARASGIPARMVHGMLLYAGVDAGFHYWSEAFVPPHGWVPFDLHGWVVAAGDKRDARSRFLVGHLPYQMVLLRMPRTKLELGLRHPKRWYRLSRIDGRGQRNVLYDLDTGAIVAEDYFEVEIAP